VSLATGFAGRDVKVIGLVSAGHFVSHFYILALPPLFPLLKDDFAVSYAALGLLMTVFNVFSGLLQIPVGFLVDRLGPRNILILGIVVEAIAFAAMGFWGLYPALLTGMAVAGVANSVYHPADYAILTSKIGGGRMGRAFSVHTFAGFAGNAAAPVAMVMLAALWDWRIALVAAGVAGIAVAAALAWNGAVLDDARLAASAAAPQPARPRMRQDVGLLLSPPILMCFVFFVMLSMSSGGLNSFAVVALVALYDTPLAMATAALTTFLACSALGILAGGIIADRTARHERVASVGFASTAVIIALIGTFAMPPLLIILALAAGGLLWGMIMPSRDMLVRAVTPPGASGKVFGFVSTGLNLGSAVTPVLFGWIMDVGDPRWLFWAAAAFMLLALGTVFITRAAR